MKKIYTFALMFAACALVACGGSQPKAVEAEVETEDVEDMAEKIEAEAEDMAEEIEAEAEKMAKDMEKKAEDLLNNML